MNQEVATVVRSRCNEGRARQYARSRGGRAAQSVGGGDSRRGTSAASWGRPTPAKCRGRWVRCCAGQGLEQLPPHALAPGGRGQRTGRVRAPKRRGPKPDLAKAESRRVETLEREVIRLRQKLGGPSKMLEDRKKTLRPLGAAHGRGALAMNSAKAISPLQIGIAAACIGLGVPRATF